MKIGVVILLLCFVMNGFSQENNLLDKVKIPVFVDTLFIDHDVNNWSIRVYNSYKDNRFQLSNEEHKIRYDPNNPFGIGIGFATKKLVLDVGVNIKSKRKEPTERFDLQATMILNRHHVDYFLQSYQGFNVKSDLEFKEEFRKDFSSISSGINYLYLFNAEEYSVSAMKSGLSRQKKAALSLSLGGFLFMDRNSADSSFIPSLLQGHFNEEAQITNLFALGGGLLGGFSVTVPFLKYLFVSASITPGIGLIYKEVKTENLEYKPSNPMLYQLGSSGILGYNGDKFYINFSTGISLFITDLDYGNTAYYNTTKAKLAVGYKLGNN